MRPGPGPLRRSASAPGGAGEEDHALGVAGHLVERAHHHRLAPAVGLRHRDRCPQTGVELAAKFRHQPPLILRKLDIPFRDESLAVTRFHPQKTHRQIMPDGRRAPLYLVVFEAARLTTFAFFFFRSGTTRATFGHRVARVNSNGPSETPLVSVTISSTVAWGTAGVPGFAPLGRYE